MPVTKEQVLEKAKELSMTLTDAQVDQYVKDDKLPTAEPKAGTKVEELIEKYSQRTLAEMLLELRNENAARRVSEREAKTQAEQATNELAKVKETAAKYPELEEQFKKSQAIIESHKTSEKKRREAALAKLDEKKRAGVSYLLDVDRIDAASFETTLELLVPAGSPGTTAGLPSGAPGGPSLKDQLAQAWKEGRTAEAVAIQRKIDAGEK